MASGRNRSAMRWRRRLIYRTRSGSGWDLNPGRRLVLSVHNTFWPMGDRPASFKDIARSGLLGRRACALDGAIEASEENVLANLRASPSGAATRPFSFRRSRDGARCVHERTRRLIYLGRIEQNKGIFPLLVAFEELSGRFLELRSRLAGSGGAAARLESRVAEQAPGRVQYLGPLDAAGVYRELDAADMLACPTWRGFPKASRWSGSKRRRMAIRPWSVPLCLLPSPWGRHARMTPRR